MFENASELSEYIKKQRLMKQEESGVDMSKFYKDKKMYSYDIDGKKITTNYGASSYPYFDGNDDRPSVRVPISRTEEEILYELLNEGYTKIRFRQLSTRVRGLCDVYAFYS